MLETLLLTISLRLSKSYYRIPLSTIITTSLYLQIRFSFTPIVRQVLVRLQLLSLYIRRLIALLLNLVYLLLSSKQLLLVLLYITLGLVLFTLYFNYQLRIRDNRPYQLIIFTFFKRSFKILSILLLIKSLQSYYVS